MHCLVFTDTDLYSLTKGKSYLAKHKWRRSTCLRDQCYDVGCHPFKLHFGLSIITGFEMISRVRERERERERERKRD